ncbi:hypothetical protein KXV92_005418 [Aspergillus fumigatus]|nr:hypothetical protein KXV98_003879 [Aspergillus fumigatus]KAH3187290.1 hypothetical protein KXV92_005418 [Aspergillus fumigatus]
MLHKETWLRSIDFEGKRQLGIARIVGDIQVSLYRKNLGSADLPNTCNSRLVALLLHWHRHGQQQALYINPLNDCHVLAGMGTVGLEILQQIKDVKNLEAVFCSARAGGALEAIGIAIKLFAPQVKVIGVGFQSSAAASSPSFSISIVDSVASRAPEGTSPNSINGLNVLPVQKNRLTLSEQLETSTTSNHTEGEATSEATRIHPSVVDEIMFVEPYDRSKAMEDVFVEFRVLIDADGSLAVAGLKRHAFSKRLGMETPSLVAIISSTNLVVSGNSCDPTRENEQ